MARTKHGGGGRWPVAVGELSFVLPCEFPLGDGLSAARLDFRVPGASDVEVCSEVAVGVVGGRDRTAGATWLSCIGF